MRITAFFAWYDFWVGFYYDRKKMILYWCPIPMVVVKCELNYDGYYTKDNYEPN